MQRESNEEESSDLFAIQERSYARASKTLLAAYPKDHSMDATELKEFLDRKVYAVLATSRPDGRAHAAPVGFLVSRGAFWIASVEGTRTRNLRLKSWASIVVTEGEPPGNHLAVIAEGRVRIYEGMKMKSILQEDGFIQSWKQKMGRKPDWATILIELRPERLFSYDARKEKQK